MSFNNRPPLILCLICLLALGLPIKRVQAQSTVELVSVVQAEGLEAVFECLYPGASSHNWGINGTFPPEGDFPLNGVVRQTQASGDTPARLFIPATEEYNNTVVQCVAVVIQGGMPMGVQSYNATLLVEEIVANGATNSMDTITISWNSQTFTNITYCVTVNRTSFGVSENITQSCKLTGPEYTFPSPGHSVCDRFSFTVTPTEGDMRGTSSNPVTGFFTRATGTGGRTRVVEDGVPGTESVTFEAMIPNCTTFVSYQVDSPSLMSPPVTGNLSLAKPIIFSLMSNRLTNVTVTLIDINGTELVFENNETSTYDIQNTTVTLCENGTSLCVTVEYINGSDATGALVCAMPMIPNGQPNLDDMILVAVPRDMSENYPIPVSSGNYTIVAFDIEMDSLPRLSLDPSMAAFSIVEPIEVQNGGEESSTRSLAITSYLLPDNQGVKVTCRDTYDNCLILVQSIDDPSRAAVRLIMFNDSRTIEIEFPGERLFVIVYTWQNERSIFEGNLSYAEIPNALPPTTTDLSPLPSVSTADVGILTEGEIAGVVIVVLVLLLTLILAAILIGLVLNKKKMRKVQLKPDNTYNRIESNSAEGAPTNGASQEMDVGAPIGLYDVITKDNMAPEQDTTCNDNPENLPGAYDVVRKENMASPNYETIESAKASMSATTTPTADEPPPLPPPKITEDKDAPPLPPAYNPRIDSSTELLAAVEEPETVQEESGPLGEEPVVAADEPLAEDTLERRAKKQVQYTMVQPTTTPHVGDDPQRLDPTLVVYAEVDKKKLKPKSEETESAPALPPPLCTADAVRAELDSLTGRWEDLAKTLNVDEDRIDEIFTINENDQLRLHDLVEYYFKNVHYSHTWDEIVRTLRNIGEHGAADRICQEKIREPVEPPQYASVV